MGLNAQWHIDQKGRGGGDSSGAPLARGARSRRVHDSSPVRGGAGRAECRMRCRSLELERIHESAKLLAACQSANAMQAPACVRAFLARALGYGAMRSKSDPVLEPRARLGCARRPNVSFRAGLLYGSSAADDSIQFPISAISPKEARKVICLFTHVPMHRNPRQPVHPPCGRRIF